MSMIYRQFITGAVTQPCRYKGALQSTNSGICFAEQVGLKSSFKRILSKYKKFAAEVMATAPESIDLTARRAAGSLLQHLGPAAEKARSPNRVFIRLTRRSHLSVDRSRIYSPEADESASLQ